MYTPSPYPCHHAFYIQQAKLVSVYNDLNVRWEINVFFHSNSDQIVLTGLINPRETYAPTWSDSIPIQHLNIVAIESSIGSNDTQHNLIVTPGKEINLSTLIEEGETTDPLDPDIDMRGYCYCS